MNAKKNYQAPLISKVNLRPQEAVLTACKTSGSTIGHRGAMACSGGTSCSANGSS